MIIKVILLFLLGTAMASDIFMNKLKPSAYEVVASGFKPSGCPMGADLAPLICKLMQTNMDLYYKPQLITPSTYIPQLIVQKCEAPEITVDLELPATIGKEKPVLIPQPPELPPISIPKFPVPVITEELPEKINEPSDKPEMPLFHISEPPQLPALEMPVIPQIIDHPEPYSKEDILQIDYNSIEEKPIHIPEPPKLPAFNMPEFPVHVEIPSGPVLSAMDLPTPSMIAEKPEGGSLVNEKVISPEIYYNLVNFEPVSIPQAPLLTDFVMPEGPAIPIYFQEKPAAFSPISAHFRPLAILPAAPELPPLITPELPVPVPNDCEKSVVVKEDTIEEQREKEETLKPDFDLGAYQRIVVPQPPELPTFVMPELPSLTFEQEPIKTYFEPLAPLPPAPELPPVSLPEFPVNVVIPSSPVLSPIDFSQPIVVKEQPNEEPRQKEETPKFEIDLAPYPNYVVPQPPTLHAFVMPELPTLSFEQEPIKSYFKPLAPLPTAPELPALSLPEIPVNVDILSAPVIPAIDILSLTMIAEQQLPEIDYNIINSAPISIPAPPELPAFVMPELPVKVEELPKVTEAPELPSVPKWPQFKPDFTAILPSFINKPCESSGKLEMDFAALANPYFERYLNDKIKESHNILIPTKPMNPEFVSSPCVYNLVMHHVLPNIASDHFRSWEKTKALTPSFIPCA